MDKETILVVALAIGFAVFCFTHKAQIVALAASHQVDISALTKTLTDMVSGHAQANIAQSNAAGVVAQAHSDAIAQVAKAVQAPAVTLLPAVSSGTADAPTVLTPATAKDPHSCGFSKPSDAMPVGYWCAVSGSPPDGMTMAQDVGRPNGNFNAGTYIVNAGVAHMANGVFVPGEAPAA